MAGRGPAPKDSKIRRNIDPIGTTTIEFVPGKQPELPEGPEWPLVTVDWWKSWQESPLSDQFTAVDWHFMLDTALLHKAVWGEGELKWLAELRLREAKVGATAEDRARLRIQFANADDADDKRDRKRNPRHNEERYKGLQVVGAE